MTAERSSNAFIGSTTAVPWDCGDSVLARIRGFEWSCHPNVRFRSTSQCHNAYQSATINKS